MDRVMAIAVVLRATATASSPSSGRRTMWWRPPLSTPPLRMATRTRPSCASSFARCSSPRALTRRASARRWRSPADLARRVAGGGPVGRGSAASGWCTPSSRPRYRPREDGPSLGGRAMTRSLAPSTTPALAGCQSTQSPFCRYGRTDRGHPALPAMRAITHVEGKAIRSSRRARRGAGCWLRTTIGASGRTPISSSRIAWRRASAARRPLTGRACPDGRPGGGGVRSATLRTIKRRSTPGAGLRSLSPAVAVVGTRPDGALACRPGRAPRAVRHVLLLAVPNRASVGDGRETAPVRMAGVALQPITASASISSTYAGSISAELCTMLLAGRMSPKTSPWALRRVRYGCCAMVRRCPWR